MNRKILRFLIEIIFASFVVQIALFPLLVNTFHQVSWVALPANLFMIPYFSFILMPLGMLGLLFSWIHPAWAPLFFKLAAYFLKLALELLKMLTLPSWSTTWIPSMNAFQIILYVGMILVFLISLEKRKKILVLLALLILNIAVWIYPVWADFHNSNLRISFLDVGQGDSILIEFPHGKKMLVDAGGVAGTSFDVGEKVLIPTLLGRGITHLDYLVLTHPHPDHFGGIMGLLKVYRPQEFWWNGEKVESPDFLELLKILEQKQIPIFKKDSVSQEVNVNGVKIQFLHPSANAFFPDKPDAATLNNHSLVMNLEDRGFSVLLSGDVQKEGEMEMWANNILHPVDLLKVPHHGSNTSSTEKFLDRLKPHEVVIQLGRNNRFGFPKPEVLESYQKIGAKVYRTDQNGEINFTWDGSKTKISCYEGC